MDHLLKPSIARPEFDGLSDYFVIRAYDFIRNEVLVDAATSVDAGTKERADRLLTEIDRRGLFCKPIEWPAHLISKSEAAL
ncbi:MAG: hypothetical protein EKK33_18430 [Bradyrhizobiaceae bacterium]|jgi:hypothetical protein|nr:MAG: hypothetical protein EKK33_18430 [Bradyrhizobiaceae bacterium]